MAHKIRFSAQAKRDVQFLTDYLTRYSDEVADLYVSELASAIEGNIASRPHTWQFFFLTGAPFRAYLFKISRNMSYWVVYQVDEENEAIDVLRVWNCAQDPDEFST
jgi:plasmid stabilization system protein ParE